MGTLGKADLFYFVTYFVQLHSSLLRIIILSAGNLLLQISILSINNKRKLDHNIIAQNLYIRPIQICH